MKLKNLFTATVTLLILNTSCSKTDTGAGQGPGTIAEKTETNVSYGTDPLQVMDIYLPANRSVATTKVMILIHGGAWTIGDKSDFAANMDTLKKRIPDYAIFNINYRLAAFPATNTFPTQELDVKAAVEFIYGNRSNYLISDKIVLMGASAGGHLSLLHAYKYTSPVKIKAVVDFFGPTDMVDMYNNPGSFPALSVALLLNGTPTSNATLYQQSSPLTYATAASCPTIILQGGLDPLVNATTQSLALHNKLTTAGATSELVPYPLGG
ncbi:MAG: alpha/beta hydrolase, partial [Ferruginibacter sp.]